MEEELLKLSEQADRIAFYIVRQQQRGRTEISDAELFEECPTLYGAKIFSRHGSEQAKLLLKMVRERINEYDKRNRESGSSGTDSK